jgi:hypothetical protein
MNKNKTVQQMAVYVAFTPFTPWTYGGRAWPLDDLGQTATNSSDRSRFVELRLKGSQPYCSLLCPTVYGIPNNSTIGFGKTIDTSNALWLRFGDDLMYCSVQRTRYRLEFDARTPLTALKSYIYIHEGVSEGDTPENVGFIVAIQPLLDILRDNRPGLCVITNINPRNSTYRHGLSKSRRNIEQDLGSRTEPARPGCITATKRPYPFS